MGGGNPSSLQSDVRIKKLKKGVVFCKENHYRFKAHLNSSNKAMPFKNTLHHNQKQPKLLQEINFLK